MSVFTPACGRPSRLARLKIVLPVRQAAAEGKLESSPYHATSRFRRKLIALGCPPPPTWPVGEQAADRLSTGDGI